MLKIKSTIDVSKFAANKLFPEAQEEAAIRMLDWMSSGSMGSPKKPPFRTGVLASSGSVFFKSKLLSVSPNVAESGTPTPYKTYTAKNVAWIFNTNYATKMHEGKSKHEDKSLNPGPYSVRDPNMHPGNQWVAEHLQKDKNNYTKIIAEFIK